MTRELSTGPFFVQDFCKSVDDRWIEESMNDPVIVFTSLNFLPVLLRYN